MKLLLQLLYKGVNNRRARKCPNVGTAGFRPPDMLNRPGARTPTRTMRALAPMRRRNPAGCDRDGHPSPQTCGFCFFYAIANVVQPNPRGYQSRFPGAGGRGRRGPEPGTHLADRSIVVHRAVRAHAADITGGVIGKAGQKTAFPCSRIIVFEEFFW